MLQQSVHGHHQKAAQATQQNEKRRGNPNVVDEIHHQHQQAHGDAQEHQARRICQRGAHGSHHRTHSRANGNHAHQRGGLRGGVAQSHRAPGQHDVAQVTAGAPKQGGGGQRNLAQFVTPQALVALPKIRHQGQQVVGQGPLFIGLEGNQGDAGIGYAGVEPSGQAVQKHQDTNRCFRWRVYGGVYQGHINRQQQT